MNISTYFQNHEQVLAWIKQFWLDENDYESIMKYYPRSYVLQSKIMQWVLYITLWWEKRKATHLLQIQREDISTIIIGQAPLNI